MFDLTVDHQHQIRVSFLLFFFKLCYEGHRSVSTAGIPLIRSQFIKNREILLVFEEKKKKNNF